MQNLLDIEKDTVTYSFTVKLGKNIKTFEIFTYKEYFMDANDNVIYIVETKYEPEFDIIISNKRKTP